MTQQTYQSPYFSQPPVDTQYAPFTPQMTRDDELDYLKNQAEAIRQQLEQIDAKMHDLEGENKE